MPQSIIIAAPSTNRAHRLFSAPAIPPWVLTKTSSQGFPFQLQLQDKDSTWYIDVSEMQNPEEVALDYIDNPDLDAAFRTQVADMTFFLLSFNDYSTFRRYLIAIFTNNKEYFGNSWVDNDYGIILTGREFFGKLLSDAEWDWRFPPS